MRTRTSRTRRFQRSEALTCLMHKIINNETWRFDQQKIDWRRVRVKLSERKNHE